MFCKKNTHDIKCIDIKNFSRRCKERVYDLEGIILGYEIGG